LPIKFEFTGRNTTQRNYLAEVGLATIAVRGRAMMSAAKVPKEVCQIFWQEAFQTSTYLDGLILTTVNGVTKTRFEHWENCLPRFVQYFKKMGSSGSGQIPIFNHLKNFDCGKICMFVGYSPNHAANTLRMWDPDTKRVHLNRDIVWLNKMFFNNNPNFIDVPRRPNKNSHKTSTNNKAGSDPENESDLNNEFQIDKDNDREDIVNNNIIENTKTTRSGRVIKKLERF
jgi:hypothetical protein